MQIRDTTPRPRPTRRYRCEACGTDYPAVWAAHLNRWCAPRLNPCEACYVETALQRKAACDRAMIAAGFPEPLVPMSFGRAVRQGPRESDEVFAQRVRGLDGTPFGVFRTNKDVLDALARWKPATDTRTLVLLGPAGVGKTTAMAATARKLLDVEPGWEQVPLTLTEAGTQEHLDRLTAVGRGHRLRRQGRVGCKYVRLVDVLDAQQRRKWKSDPDGAEKLATFRGVLFLDEIGSSAEVDKIEIDAMEHVISTRVDWGLCTVFGSNMTRDALGGVAGIYGRRASSRLERAAWMHFRPPSWRSL